MDLDHLETRLQGPTGGRGEVLDDPSDLVPGQLGRHRVALVEGDRARRDRAPAARRVRGDCAATAPGAFGGGFAPGVPELDAGHGAVPAQEPGDAGEPLLLTVVPQTEVGRADP